MSDADIIKGMVGGVTKKWTKQRKAEERASSARVRRQTMFSMPRYTIKDAAYEYMERAYNKVSSNGMLPAHARQVMYAARGYIQEQTGKDLSDQYFIQTLLVGYMQDYGLEGSWNIVFDARGHLNEPHTKKIVPLGTLEVRDYLKKTSLASGDFNDLKIDLEDDLISTCGPERRYSAILFIEKEGFMPLFDEVKLAKRYDIAIMSTKGMSVTASREAVDRLCGNYNIPLLILRDFDKAGFSIAKTIASTTERYMFRNNIEVHDLGLRLEDVHKYDLPSESVSYGNTCPRRNLRKNGATQEEIDFLLHERVELNAFTSEELIEWIESKLDEHGIKKVVPDEEALSDAYKRTLILCDVRKAIAEATENAAEDHEDFALPDDFTDRVNDHLKHYPTESWDQAVSQIAYEETE
jgi:hypothetical protein